MRERIRHSNFETPYLVLWFISMATYSSGEPNAARPDPSRRRENTAPPQELRRAVSKDGHLLSYAHRNGFRRCANRDISAQLPCTNASFFFRLHPLI